MSTIRYQRVVNSVVMNEWMSTYAGADYTEPGWGDPSTYMITSTDVTSQVTQQAAVQQALANQTVGATIIANVAALNESKLQAGTMTMLQFTAMLADQNYLNIERLLWNGS